MRHKQESETLAGVAGVVTSILHNEHRLPMLDLAEPVRADRGSAGWLAALIGFAIGILFAVAAMLAMLHARTAPSPALASVVEAVPPPAVPGPAAPVAPSPVRIASREPVRTQHPARSVHRPKQRRDQVRLASTGPTRATRTGARDALLRRAIMLDQRRVRLLNRAELRRVRRRAPSHERLLVPRDQRVTRSDTLPTTAL